MAKFITLDTFKAAVAKMKEKFLTKTDADQLYLTSDSLNDFKAHIIEEVKTEIADYLKNLIQSAVEESAKQNGRVSTSPQMGVFSIIDSNGYVTIDTTNLAAKWTLNKG